MINRILLGPIPVSKDIYFFIDLWQYRGRGDSWLPVGGLAVLLVLVSGTVPIDCGSGSGTLARGMPIFLFAALFLVGLLMACIEFGRRIRLR
jgi:hypothetical protein